MDVKFAVIFLFQIVIGILGNFSLFCHYVSLDFREYRGRRQTTAPPRDPLKHLILTNSLVILSRGIPEIMAAFELRYFLTDFGCKVVFFAHRVPKGVSIGTTRFLSAFEAITISLWNSRWAVLRGKAPKYIGSSNVLCWILNIKLNIMIPGYISDKWNNRNTSETMDLSFHDVLCLGLITWGSGFMVFTLYKHKQQVQHIHRTKVSSESFPKIRATRSIFLLVSIFVSFYTVSSIICIYFSISHKTSW
ncbi:unnamed protein product [Nyctereutes procyonoides]|uniref:Vomeronasal type-1 receptor n=1 Tax=Nyctereutes procyonoides TaxID=34880 RepID=A0A811ZUS6_NYCPR|nr:unnamed protein product [Nyctereutes procyonoides]